MTTVTLLVWGLVLIMGAVAVLVRHVRHERHEAQVAEAVRQAKEASYQCLLTELNEVECLPTQPERVEGIVAAQAHYFDRITHLSPLHHNPAH